MIAAKLFAQPAPRGVAERAQPAAIPGPVARVVSEARVTVVRFGGDGGSEAGGILPHGPFGRRAASRELPECRLHLLPIPPPQQRGVLVQRLARPVVVLSPHFWQRQSV